MSISALNTPVNMRSGSLTSSSLNSSRPTADSAQVTTSQDAGPCASLEETFASCADQPVSLIIQSRDQEKLAALKAQLLADNAQNKVTADLPIIGGFSIEMAAPGQDTLEQLTQAQENGQVSISLDNEAGYIVSQGEHIPGQASGASANKGLAEPGVSVNTPATEASSIGEGGKQTNVMLGVRELHEQGFTGKGTCVCVLDSGIAPHPDFGNRIIAFKDCVNGRDDVPYDDCGHGTHCAGIVAGDGTNSGGKNVGVAPEANIVGVKVLDACGQGSTSQIIHGIQWAITHKGKYGIDVLSISLGRPIERTRFLDPMTMACQVAEKFGLTVVISAGNEGPDPGTVASPGNAPDAITVGALDDGGTETTDDDWPAYFSSCGPTKFDHLEKPDIMAPGVDIISCSNDAEGYVKMSGTSMAAPFAAGVAALMKGANDHIKNDQIKSIIMDTATPIKYVDGEPVTDRNKFGAGIVDPRQAVDQALALAKK